MCCNGTLFNYVTLVPDDMPKLAKYPQLKLKERKGQDTFDEPCVLHTGKGCSAYDDRPATCSRYVCGVLRSVGKDEITEIEALNLIKEGRALVDHVKELVIFEEGQPIAVSTWEPAPEEFDDEARFVWNRTAYHLKKYFLNMGNEEVDPEVEVRGGSASAPRREAEPDSPRPSRRKPKAPRNDPD